MLVSSITPLSVEWLCLVFIVRKSWPMMKQRKLNKAGIGSWTINWFFLETQGTCPVENNVVGRISSCISNDSFER